MIPMSPNPGCVQMNCWYLGIVVSDIKSGSAPLPSNGGIGSMFSMNSTRFNEKMAPSTNAMPSSAGLDPVAICPNDTLDGDAKTLVANAM